MNTPSLPALHSGWWVALFGFALGLRVAFLVLVYTTPLQNVYPYMDGDGYLNHAVAIMDGSYWMGESDDSLERMPLYPAVIALLGWLPDVPVVVQGWHVLLDTCTLGLIVVFARRTLGDAPAWWAGALYAVYPLALYRLPLMNVETLGGTLLAMVGVGLYYWLRVRTCKAGAALAVILALLLYVNPAFQALAVFIAAIVFWQNPIRKSIPLLASFLIPLVLICAAWGVRNYAITGEFFLFDIRSGHAFWIGNYQPADGRWEGDMRDTWEARFDAIRTHVEQQHPDSPALPYYVQQELYREGLREIAADPVGAIGLAIKKAWRFWFVPASETRLLVSFVVQAAWLVLAGVGLVMLWRKPDAWLVPVLLIGYAMAVYSASYACLRFSHPLMPWVCVLGGSGVHAILVRFGVIAEKTNE